MQDKPRILKGLELPSVLYPFGTTEAWQSACERAVKENIAVGWGHDITLDNGKKQYNVPVLSGDGHHWYGVTFTYDSEGMLFGCTCQAGQQGRRCKHVAKAAMGRQWLPVPEGVEPDPIPGAPTGEARDLILEMLTGRKEL